MSHQSSIDLEYRPSTYWPESENREQRLARIHGKARRDITRQTLESGGIDELNSLGPELSVESLSEQARQAWGGIHPSHMGGEYLPPYIDSEVEIARISLKSVTSDQISIRACGWDGDIQYRVVDEYETEYQLPIENSHEPLTLTELIMLIDQTNHSFNETGSGLIRYHWDRNTGFTDPEEAIDFVSVESAFYPGLTTFFAAEARRWLETHKEPDEEFECDDEEDFDGGTSLRTGRPIETE